MNTRSSSTDNGIEIKIDKNLQKNSTDDIDNPIDSFKRIGRNQK